MENIIFYKALSDAFVAGKSKQTFENFKKEWLLLNNINEIRNKTIDEVIDKLSIRVEFGCLEGRWDFIKGELERLKH